MKVNTVPKKIVIKSQINIVYTNLDAATIHIVHTHNLWTVEMNLLA